MALITYVKMHVEFCGIGNSVFIFKVKLSIKPCVYMEMHIHTT